MAMFFSHALSPITNQQKMTARNDWSFNTHAATLRAIGDIRAQLTSHRLLRPRVKHWTHCILRRRDMLSLFISIKATSRMQTTWAFSMFGAASATVRKSSGCPGTRTIQSYWLVIWPFFTSGATFSGFGFVTLSSSGRNTRPWRNGLIVCMRIWRPKTRYSCLRLLSEAQMWAPEVWPC